MVAESKNYKEVSEKLYLTESTISSHITNLEKKLNLVLFYRERDGLVLTKAGKELYDLMHEKIKDIEFAEDAIIQNNDISRAKITIGCPSHIAIFYLAKCITKARKDYPDLKIDIMGITDYNGLIGLLLNHVVDFVIMDVIPKDERTEVKAKKLKEISNIFISKEQIKIKNLKDLEKYKFVLNYENSFSTRKLFEVLEKYDVRIKADIQVDITEMRIEEVKQGQGIGYVIREIAEEAIKNKEVYEVKLPVELPGGDINLVYMEKYLTKIDKIFIKKYLTD